MYNRLLTISQYRANIMQYFYILTNSLNYSSSCKVLPICTIFTTLSIKVIFKNNKLSNSSEFWHKSKDCLKIPLYDLGFKLLLILQFKIVITGYTLVITASLVNIKLFNDLK